MAEAAQLLVQWRNAAFQPSLSNNQTLSKGRTSNDQSAALERLVPYLALATKSVTPQLAIKDYLFGASLLAINTS